MKLAGVVLAAGASTRLGTPKQLVVHRGEPLVRRAARSARDAGAEPVIVVLGAHAALIAPALDALDGVDVVVNAAWATGMASSLAAGIAAALRAPIDGVLVTLSDQPLVDAVALAPLVDAFARGAAIVASTYGDALGVPAIFARAHAEALRSLDGDAGAGAWLRRHRALVTTIAMDGASLDVDLPEDLERLSTL